MICTKLYFLCSLLFTSIRQSSPLECLSIDGTIQKNTVDNFFHQIEELRQKGYYGKIKIHFDTPGGSVLDGMRLLDYIERNHVECSATRAYSMGFVLFQACKTRKIEKYGSLMQHDMKLNLQMMDFSNFKSYYKYIKKIYEELIEKQIKRIGISEKKFLSRIKNDWWMDAKDAIYYNCADEII